MSNFKVTDLLVGVDLSKYRKRLDRLHRPAMNPIQMLALEIHVRQRLKELGRDCFNVDVEGEFLDHVDPMLTYAENKALMDERLKGVKLC
jgi:hypothetical protein